MIDPLADIEIDTTKTKVGGWCPCFHGNKTILTAEDCHRWLMDQLDLIGWTYTVRACVVRQYSFKRLIANKTDQPISIVRLATNIHAKVYLTEKEMLIGSFNLTRPEIEDIAVLIKDQTQIKFMRNQFEKHWKALA